MPCMHSYVALPGGAVLAHPTPAAASTFARHCLIDSKCFIALVFSLLLLSCGSSCCVSGTVGTPVAELKLNTHHDNKV